MNELATAAPKPTPKRRRDREISNRSATEGGTRLRPKDERRRREGHDPDPDLDPDRDPDFDSGRDPGGDDSVDALAVAGGCAGSRDARFGMCGPRSAVPA